MATKIMECKRCKTHVFQDSKYGVNKRVFNKGGTSDHPKWTCTVCGVEQTSGVKK